MADVGGPLLRFLDASGTRHEVELDPASPRLTVGRSSEADVALTWDSEVSRIHAVIESVGAGWTVVDDGLSRNGTFVNAERIVGRRRLHNSDRIRIGSTTIGYYEFGPEAGDETRLASAVLPSPRSLSDTQRAVLVALCRPYKHGASFASPASNQQIAEELFLSVDAIKTHLRTLFSKFGVETLPQNQKRLRLVEIALQAGVISERDL